MLWTVGKCCINKYSRLLFYHTTLYCHSRTLNKSTLKEWGVTPMPEYSDPYHKRPMTMGEIGCFLSHYIVWQKVVI